MALTDSKLKAMLKGHDDSRPRKVADREGLSVLWRKSGKVSFVYRYRYLGKQKDVTLGTYTGKDSGLLLGDARRKVDELKTEHENGRDPALVLKLAKDERLKPVTVKDALEYWVESYAKKKRVNWEKTQSQFSAWIYPRIGDLPLVDCETRHWLQVFDDYQIKSPVGAGYCFQACKQALKYCRVRRFAISNVLDDLTIKDVAKPQRKKDRYLSLDEVNQLIEWAKPLTPHHYYANLALILLYTGARTQEVRLSNISEWNCEKWIWTVPKANSKTDVTIERPIPNAIRPLIKSLIKQNQQSKGNTLLLGEEKNSPAVSSYPQTLCRKLKHEKWRWHDLRRTLATHLNEQGVNPFVVESLLGHSLQGTMAHYVHAGRLEEKRIALDTWEQMINDDSNGNNIVSLRVAR